MGMPLAIAVVYKTLRTPATHNQTKPPREKRKRKPIKSKTVLVTKSNISGSEKEKANKQPSKQTDKQAGRSRQDDLLNDRQPNQPRPKAGQIKCYPVLLQPVPSSNRPSNLVTASARYPITDIYNRITVQLAESVSKPPRNRIGMVGIVGSQRHR